MPSSTGLGFGVLGLRLAAAFVGVALAAVLTAIMVNSLIVTTDADQLLAQQQAEVSKAASATAADSYARFGWIGVRMHPIRELVASDGAAARVTDSAGKVVYATPGFAGFGTDGQVIRPVRVRGTQVGLIAVRFGRGSLVAAVARFKAERWRARATAAGIAALLALAVSLAVTRLITAPLEALLVAVRARGAGARSVRIVNIRTVGVLRELLEGFNFAADRLDRLERLRRDLVVDVAHELRTPIAILQASHEAMLDGVTEPTPENLGSLRDEVLRLARMIDDLQSLAAAESAAMHLKLADEDLAAIAGEAAASLGDPFDVAGVRLERRLSPVRVRCDRERMREVVTNLLTNALKFTPVGGGVRLEVGPSGPGLARLQVRDTGVGIPPEEIPMVTERFFRGDRSSAMAGGSGIGLTIVAGLVRAHDGELSIVSEPGQGTEVTVTLPRPSAGPDHDGRQRPHPTVVRPSA